MNIVFGIAIGIGAALGAIARWMLSLGLNRLLPTLPLGTLMANLIGAFLMGIAMAVFVQYESIPLVWRLALTTGFLGGLTTFSSFSAETLLLMERGEWLATCTIIGTHVIGSLALTLIGYALTHWLLRS
ncbi:MAG: fluoride efflux transporter CrcB [Dokdonella sp.]